MPNYYDIGDVVRSSVAFATTAGSATDPTVITVTYKIDDGDTISKVYGVDGEVVKASTGNYYIDLTGTVGTWYIRWIGIGTVAAVAEDWWHIVESRVI